MNKDNTITLPVRFLCSHKLLVVLFLKTACPKHEWRDILKEQRAEYIYLSNQGLGLTKMKAEH